MDLFLSLLRIKLQFHFQQSLCNALTWHVLFLITSYRSKTAIVSQMEKATAVSQCCFHGSLCQVNAENFWILRFTVWLFCLLPKCNLSEMLYQVWALRRWGGRHNHRQTSSYVLNRCMCQKLEHLAPVWWNSSWLCFFCVTGHTVVFIYNSFMMLCDIGFHKIVMKFFVCANYIKSCAIR